jgi:hypothetical protein
MRGGDAEDGHDGVADELLHDAAPRRDHRRHRREILREKRAEALGIEPLAESGRPGEVGEEDGDELSLLLRSGEAVEAVTARGAELGTSLASAPQDGQGSTSTCPQEGQKRAPASISASQAGQTASVGTLLPSMSQHVRPPRTPLRTRLACLKRRAAYNFSETR